MWGLILGLWLAAGGIAVAEPDNGGFTFSPPAGWIDISRGAPEAQRQKASPALLAMADNPRMPFVAFEPDSDADGFVENVNAVVQTGKRPPLATPAMLAELVKAVEGQLAAQGMTYRSLKQELVKIGGVTAGRLVGELTAPNGHVSLVQYAIPGARAHAMLTFTTVPEKLSHYEPIFEAAAQATRGVVDPSASSSEKLGSFVGMIVGGLVGGIVTLIAARARRKRRDTATTPGVPGPA